MIITRFDFETATPKDPLTPFGKIDTREKHKPNTPGKFKLGEVQNIVLADGDKRH